MFAKFKKEFLSFFTIDLSEESHTFCCPLCKREGTFNGGVRSMTSYFRAQDRALEAGWKRLWLTQKLTCPTCVKKLSLGLVPGVGVKLVNQQMLDNKKAYPLDEFNQILEPGAGDESDGSGADLAPPG
jgi:hypothetical protein